ncbi:hypothetical protein ACSSV1_003626 [Labrenzia sp. MBR-25]
MDDFENSLPGYELHEMPVEDTLVGTEDWSTEQWDTEFIKTREELKLFLSVRDPLVVLSRTAARLVVESARPSYEADRLQQSYGELAQTLILMNDSGFRPLPTSPSNFVRFWFLLSRHMHAFLRRQSRGGVERDTASHVSRRAQLQTLYYRNLFDRAGCQKTMLGILDKLDKPSRESLGYKISDLFKAMVRILEIIEERFIHYSKNIRDLMEAKSEAGIQEPIKFFCNAYPLAGSVWEKWGGYFTDFEGRRSAAFQMSELGYPWVFKLTREMLDAEFEKEIVDAVYELSARIGDFKKHNPDHIYLNNPTWQKPYVELEDGSLFAAIPQLVFSFPFAVVEQVIKGNQRLKKSYEDAKADYLEAAIEDILKNAMPSAKVYRGVYWDDPSTGKRWENDIVAFVGNYVFVFEAKSGRLKDASRRGAPPSLEDNFNDLFIEPGVQGWRLQNYIDEHGESSSLFLKDGTKITGLGFDRPKVVFRYSVCYEHFASLTSAKYYLKKLGLIQSDTAWAPVLSLGELQMIDRFLDTEVSFVHYLTRRATLEDMVELEGDEQDILSMYLTNGLCFDSAALAGNHLLLANADSFVRVKKVPRQCRTDFEVYGIELSHLWRGIVKELYVNNEQRHRFDIISAILNQLPPAMAEFERRIRRFRRGVPVGDQDLLITKFPVGKRLFVVASYLAKKQPDPEEWQETGRGIVAQFLDEYETVECATFFFLRRTKQTTFDGCSFYRYGRRPEPSGGQIGDSA